MYRISELIKLDRKTFHTNDLAIVWGIASRHTLYQTITRYVDRGILFPIYKGLYATVPVASIDPIELGKAIVHRYAYLTTETVLAQAGVISQSMYAFTYATDLSKHITVGQWSFRYRQLKDVFLHNPAGILEQRGLFVATLERAVADMLYFDPKYHFDLQEAIDFNKVRTLQEEIGYPC